MGSGGGSGASATGLTSSIVARSPAWCEGTWERALEGGRDEEV